MVALSRSSSVTPENLTHEQERQIWNGDANRLLARTAADSPRVVVDHFALRLDERVVDDFQLGVDDGDSRQLQTLLCVALKIVRIKRTM